MSKYRIAIHRVDWSDVLRVIFDAGHTPAVVAKRIGSTPPTVRAIDRGFTEPRYSQGQKLIALRNAILRSKS